MTESQISELANECDLDDLYAVELTDIPEGLKSILRERVNEVPPGLEYLARGLERRLDPGLVLENAKSIFVGLVSYGGGPQRPDPMPPGTGWISRFAWNRDYHKQVGKKIKALAKLLESRHKARTRWYVDTGAVFEKMWAERAGLGFVGKNTLLVSPRFGSFVFLGVVISDLDVSGLPVRHIDNGCGSCRACIEACPNNALDGNGKLEWNCCLGYLTVASEAPIDKNLSLAQNLYGCDLCQDVCPYNRCPDITPRPEFMPRRDLFCPSLDRIIDWCERKERDLPDPDNIFEGTPIRRRPPHALAMTARRLLADQKRGHS